MAKKWSWPWLLRAIWNPVTECDLTDDKGNGDHGKIVPFLFLVFACVMHAVGNAMAWWALMALGSLSFGYGAWRAFLKSRSVTGTLTEKIERKFEKRDVHVTIDGPPREHEAGFQPTAD